MSFLVRYFRLLILIAAPFAVFGQTPPDDDDIRTWHELQFEIPLNNKLDLLLQTTARFDKNVTRFADVRVSGGIAWKVNKSFTISPLYQYFEARDESGAFRPEHRYNLKGTYKFPFKKIGISHGSHYEYRMRTTGDLWRYRPSITIEKALPERILPSSKVFFTEEPFYISTTRRFSRNRISAGVSKSFGWRFAFDIYYLRQDEPSAQTKVLHVLGTKWKIRL